jgi:hypothetical protein
MNPEIVIVNDSGCQSSRVLSEYLEYASGRIASNCLPEEIKINKTAILTIFDENDLRSGVVRVEDLQERMPNALKAVLVNGELDPEFLNHLNGVDIVINNPANNENVLYGIGDLMDYLPEIFAAKKALSNGDSQAWRDYSGVFTPVTGIHLVKPAVSGQQLDLVA